MARRPRTDTAPLLPQGDRNRCRRLVARGVPDLWATVIQPFLNWLVESLFRLLRWSAEETAAGLRWVWNLLSPWE